MATERQAPDAILVMTELSGVVGDIQDDPDSPDANWLTASGNNVNTDVRTSFPTPSGDPTVGADLQEFQALVRQFDEAQAGTPTARIELWENGALVRAGSDTSVPDGGIVLSFTWNANELATADGSLVECKVVGTKTGGAPGKRNTVEVGAIEWNVDYTTGTTFFETLAATSVGAAAFVKDVKKPVAATSVGAAAFVKDVKKPVGATSVGAAAFVKDVKKPVAATAVGMPVLSTSTIVPRTIAAVATGVAVLDPVQLIAQALSVVTSGVASLGAAAIFTETLAATAVGVVGIVKMVKKALAAAVAGIAALVASLLGGVYWMSSRRGRRN